MTRWAFVVGVSRSGTTLLSNVLSRSPRIYVAPETKYFQQVWSQRHLLGLLPMQRRVEAVVDHLIAAEYPADPSTFAPRRDEIEAAIRRAPSLKEGFLELLRTLSDRPVLGEKTPWHTFFIDQILSIAPEARIVGITRDAPATVASMWKREGFRRVDTLSQCIARWILTNRELLAQRDRLGSDQFHLVRFEDLVRHPESTVEDLCSFLSVPPDRRMLRPSSQDSSLRNGDDRRGFDTGTLDRWRTVFDDEQVRFIRAQTGHLARRLGYSDGAERSHLLERASVCKELVLLRVGISLMRSGVYPFGAATRTAMRWRTPSGAVPGHEGPRQEPGRENG